MTNYSILNTNSNYFDVLSFDSDAECIKGLSAGRSYELPYLKVKNLTTKRIIYVGYAVKPTISTSNSYIWIIAIAIIIIMLFLIVR